MVSRSVITTGFFLFFSLISHSAAGGQEEVEVEAVDVEFIEIEADNQHSRKNNRTLAHPQGYDYRLRPEGQSKLAWHVGNEVTAAATLGGVYLGGWAAQKFLSNYISMIPASALLMGLGIGLDYATSKNWSDLGWRLGMRSPLIALNLIQSRTPFYYPNPMLESLFVEAPIAIRGAVEYSQQQAPSSIKQSFLVPGSEFDRDHMQVIYSSLSKPKLTFKFSPLPLPICERDVLLEDGDLHPELLQLSCAARKAGIKQVELIPENTRPKSLSVVIHGSDSQSQYSISFPETDSRAEWLTGVLGVNTSAVNPRPVLSPLSNCVMGEIAELVLSQTGEGDSKGAQWVSTCSDMKTTMKVKGELVLFPFGGDHGYLLVDHGLSQGIDDPVIWIDSTADNESLTQAWLDELEEKLVPGPERGIWRGISIARSVITRMAAQYGVSWLMGLKEPEEESQSSESTEGENQTQGSDGKPAKNRPPETQPETSGGPVPPVASGGPSSGPSVLPNFDPSDSNLNITLDDLRKW